MLWIVLPIFYYSALTILPQKDISKLFLFYIESDMIRVISFQQFLYISVLERRENAGTDKIYGYLVWLWYCYVMKYICFISI